MKFGSRFFMPLVGITVLALQTPANAADMLTLSGHARTRMTINDNVAGAAADNTGGTAATTDSKNAEQWDSRVRVNMDFAPSSSVKVRISPEFTHMWSSTTTTTGNTGTFSAHEAFMSWMPNNMLTLTIGRQILSYGNELIVGANDWGTTGNTFDAVRAKMNHNMGTTDFFVAKQADRTSTNVADHHFWGLYNALKVGNQFVTSADVYAFWNDNAAHGATRSRIGTLGVRAMGSNSMVDYTGELAYQQGKANSIDVKGFMVDGDVGGKFMMRHRLGVGFGYANTEFVPQFPTNHGKLGDADLVTRNNLMHIAVKTNWMWNDMWSSKVNGWWFMQANTGANASGAATRVAGGSYATGTDRSMAMEGDLAINYKADKALNFELGYALFKPMSGLNKAGNPTVYNQTASKLYLQGVATF
jgi:hypothetical protein